MSEFESDCVHFIGFSLTLGALPFWFRAFGYINWAWWKVIALNWALWVVWIVFIPCIMMGVSMARIRGMRRER